MDASTVAVIEQYIFDAWDAGMTGDEVLRYVCSMSCQPRFEVELVLNELIDRMTK